MDLFGIGARGAELGGGCFTEGSGLCGGVLGPRGVSPCPVPAPPEPVGQLLPPPGPGLGFVFLFHRLPPTPPAPRGTRRPDTAPGLWYRAAPGLRALP